MSNVSQKVATVNFKGDTLITLDNPAQKAYCMTQGVSKPPILHSVIATPSDFLLPITFCYGQDGATRETAQPTVYGVLNILSTLFQTRVKSQYTGVLANV
ncbi:hypothetical protein [Moraxella ovis]|uniref:hypothetical protein n=1 Tax=Moraxella ovis TaxID=29433 RepID=UPI000D98B7EB|nr:hypothetical protein [Moraxella ovis]SPX85341.1 Uncharacterised protein [Moraxella ovis]STZ06356.1 Uncharacterised protein [Moraxella ovis]